MKARLQNELLNNLRDLAQKEKKATKKLFARLKKRPPKDLDATVSNLHDEVFSEVDCLQCANCCRTTSPIIRDKDVDRMAQHLKVRPATLVSEYMRLDEDGDYVFLGAPCPFLGSDNYCSIYEARPKACREYPHTDRKNFHQILDLTVKNTSVCPAVYKIVESLRRLY